MHTFGGTANKRPWGGNIFDVFKDNQGNQCARVSVGERESAKSQEQKKQWSDHMDPR